MASFSSFWAHTKDTPRAVFSPVLNLFRDEVKIKQSNNPYLSETEKREEVYIPKALVKEVMSNPEEFFITLDFKEDVDITRDSQLKSYAIKASKKFDRIIASGKIPLIHLTEDDEKKDDETDDTGGTTDDAGLGMSRNAFNKLKTFYILLASAKLAKAKNSQLDGKFHTGILTTNNAVEKLNAIRIAGTSKDLEAAINEAFGDEKTSLLRVRDVTAEAFASRKEARACVNDIITGAKSFKGVPGHLKSMVKDMVVKKRSRLSRYIGLVLIVATCIGCIPSLMKILDFFLNSDFRGFGNAAGVDITALHDKLIDIVTIPGIAVTVASLTYIIYQIVTQSHKINPDKPDSDENRLHGRSKALKQGIGAFFVGQFFAFGVPNFTRLLLTADYSSSASTTSSFASAITSNWGLAIFAVIAIFLVALVAYSYNKSTKKSKRTQAQKEIEGKKQGISKGIVFKMDILSLINKFTVNIAEKDGPEQTITVLNFKKPNTKGEIDKKTPFISHIQAAPSGSISFMQQASLSDLTNSCTTPGKIFNASKVSIIDTSGKEHEVNSSATSGNAIKLVSYEQGITILPPQGARVLDGPAVAVKTIEKILTGFKDGVTIDDIKNLLEYISNDNIVFKVTKPQLLYVKPSAVVEALKLVLESEEMLNLYIDKTEITGGVRLEKQMLKLIEEKIAKISAGVKTETQGIPAFIKYALQSTIPIQYQGTIDDMYKTGKDAKNVDPYIKFVQYKNTDKPCIVMDASDVSFERCKTSDTLTLANTNLGAATIEGTAILAPANAADLHARLGGLTDAGMVPVAVGGIAAGIDPDNVRKYKTYYSQEWRKVRIIDTTTPRAFTYPGFTAAPALDFKTEMRLINNEFKLYVKPAADQPWVEIKKEDIIIDKRTENTVSPLTDTNFHTSAGDVVVKFNSVKKNAAGDAMDNKKYEFRLTGKEYKQMQDQALKQVKYVNTDSRYHTLEMNVRLKDGSFAKAQCRCMFSSNGDLIITQISLKELKETYTEFGPFYITNITFPRDQYAMTVDTIEIRGNTNDLAIGDKGDTVAFSSATPLKNVIKNSYFEDRITEIHAFLESSLGMSTDQKYEVNRMRAIGMIMAAKNALGRTDLNQEQKLLILKAIHKFRYESFNEAGGFQNGGFIAVSKEVKDVLSAASNSNVTVLNDALEALKAKARASICTTNAAAPAPAHPFRIATATGTLLSTCAAATTIHAAIVAPTGGDRGRIQVLFYDTINAHQDGIRNGSPVVTLNTLLTSIQRATAPAGITAADKERAKQAVTEFYNKLILASDTPFFTVNVSTAGRTGTAPKSFRVPNADDDLLFNAETERLGRSTFSTATLSQKVLNNTDKVSKINTSNGEVVTLDATVGELEKLSLNSQEGSKKVLSSLLAAVNKFEVEYGKVGMSEDVKALIFATFLEANGGTILKVLSNIKNDLAVTADIAQTIAAVQPICDVFEGKKLDDGAKQEVKNLLTKINAERTRLSAGDIATSPVLYNGEKLSIAGIFQQGLQGKVTVTEKGSGSDFVRTELSKGKVVIHSESTSDVFTYATQNCILELATNYTDLGAPFKKEVLTAFEKIDAGKQMNVLYQAVTRDLIEQWKFSNSFGTDIKAVDKRFDEILNQLIGDEPTPNSIQECLSQLRRGTPPTGNVNDITLAKQVKNVLEVARQNAILSAGITELALSEKSSLLNNVWNIRNMFGSGDGITLDLHARMLLNCAQVMRKHNPITAELVHFDSENESKFKAAMINISGELTRNKKGKRASMKDRENQEGRTYYVPLVSFKSLPVTITENLVLHTDMLESIMEQMDPSRSVIQEIGSTFRPLNPTITATHTTGDDDGEPLVPLRVSSR